MDVTQAAPFHQALVALKEALLTQLAEQRGGTIGRAEAAANHLASPRIPARSWRPLGTSSSPSTNEKQLTWLR